MQPATQKTYKLSNIEPSQKHCLHPLDAGML